MAAPVILIAILLAVWEIACRALAVPSYFLPPPSQVALEAAAGAPVLLASAWNTLVMALQALVLASVLACGVALLVALNRTLEKAVQPLAVALQVTPVVAIAPQVVIWAGLDHPNRAIVALAAIVAFFPIFSGALTGLKSADPDLERLFDLYGANRRQRLWRLRIPSAMPFVLEGHKVAGGLAVIGAVVAEFVAGSGAAQGLAWRILESSNRLQTARTFAAVIVLAIMGALLHAVLRYGEQAILRRLRGR
ncbi:ABC transporter permease [Iodidimonas sp. SYSU 1G8]|uniref:ABC transporter permease n=1 Tax=Iodidimonas sp. SYSU 1G8 TaxID=3133967 RepID=UPI0031FE864E